MVGALVAVVAGALAAGGYHAFLAVREHLNSSEVLLAEARDLVAREDYAAAMQRYERVAETIPRGVPERGEALFGAASSAFAWGMQGDGGNSALEVALRRVEEFQQEFPGHPKTARAEALQGILYLELGQPRRALEILGRSELRLRDQGAALPILRTLARAHAKLGEYDMARRAYLQAAGLEDNYTPDEDYGAVGLICEKLAEYNENPEAKREHLEMALEYWKHAAQVPGIDPVRADELKRRIALLESQLLALVPGNAARQRAPLEEGKDVLPGSGIDTSGHASYRAGPGGN
jgi:tetratricopeptide (TPR) repeat protein